MISTKPYILNFGKEGIFLNHFFTKSLFNNSSNIVISIYILYILTSNCSHLILIKLVLFEKKMAKLIAKKSTACQI
jgi:hypothetical protein